MERDILFVARPHFPLAARRGIQEGTNPAGTLLLILTCRTPESAPRQVYGLGAMPCLRRRALWGPEYMLSYP